MLSFGILLFWKFVYALLSQNFILVLMYLSSYTGSLLKSFWSEILILFHILLYFSNIFYHWLKDSYIYYFYQFLAYAFIWGSFMHNGNGKALPSCLNPIKYLDKSLPYDFLSDHAYFINSFDNDYFNIYFININRFFIFMKSTFNNTIFTEIQSFLFLFLYNEKKKRQNYLF